MDYFSPGISAAELRRWEEDAAKLPPPFARETGRLLQAAIAVIECMCAAGAGGQTAAQAEFSRRLTDFSRR